MLVIADLLNTTPASVTALFLCWEYLSWVLEECCWLVDAAGVLLVPQMSGGEH